MNMTLLRKTIRLHTGREISVLTPAETRRDVAATEDRGEYCIVANGTGFSLLARLFALAISLGNDELLYLPLSFACREAFQKAYPAVNTFLSGIVLFNYCTTQISVKDIVAALKNAPVKTETVFREPPAIGEYPSRWKRARRLTVKAHGPLLIISGNGDVFTAFAHTAINFASDGDTAERNDDHAHYDWDENTAKSPGVTLLYWHGA